MLQVQFDQTTPYRQMAETLDALRLGFALFDEQDRLLIWNRSFLRLFPEHVGHVRVGDPYRDNLERFYRVRLSPAELSDIDAYIAAGIQRHRAQTMPFVFEHRGQWIKVASDPVPGIGRMRIWTPIARPDDRPEEGADDPDSLETTLLPFVGEDGDAALQSDARGRIIQANSRFLQLFDLNSREEAIGRSLGDLFSRAWSRASSDLDAAHRWRLTLAEAERFPGTPFQIPLPGDRWLRILQKVLPDGAVLSSIADISEMKRLQYSLEAARNAAETANRTKDRFLAIVSHELRTPMNGILGMLDLLNDDRLDAQQAEQVEVARQSAQALLGLLDDILAFSRMASGRIELERAETNPANLVVSTARLVEARALQKGVGLRWDLLPDLPERVLVDPDRLRQVLLNLLGNAVKFTEKGEVSIAARLGKESADGRPVLHFEVSDTGIGIPAAATQRIFEPFVQADTRIGRRFGGTGLGLAISRQIVEAMEGRITVTSTEGQGSSFLVEIPCHVPGPATAGEGARPDTALPPLKVLVADDNGVNREVAKLLLERLGVTVTTAPDGPAAVAACDKPFDLILLDIEMPEMDGYQTARAIRQRAAENVDTPIVALTAHVGEHYQSMCRAAGMQGFITKPLRLSSLGAEIANVIGLSASPAA